MNNKNSKKVEQAKKCRKIDNLINVVENHTRTERHLEQYSNIGDPKYKEQARAKQNIREKQIDELKHQIIGSEKNVPSKQEQIQELKESYKLGIDYFENIQEHTNQQEL